MIGRDTEHRRTQTAEWIERNDVFVTPYFVGEPVHEVNLRRNGPGCAGGTLSNRVDDVFSRAALIGGLHDVERALGVRHNAAGGVLLPEGIDLGDGEACVDRAVSLPQNQLR